MLRDRVQAFVTDLLPAGDFWTSDASETFVRALGGVFEGIAEVADGLRDAIFPGKAERDVLLQWWDFIRSKCVGTPTDTEELRTAVLAAISSPPGHTIAGLRQIVAGQGLEFVELRHKLPVSSIPADVPFDVEPTGRILEVWNAPILHNPELVRCVVREFAQAADLVRLVAPETEWRQIDGLTAAESAFAWKYCPDAVATIQRRPSVGDPVAETAVVPLPAEHGVLRGDEIFALDPGDDLDQVINWTVTRDGNVIAESSPIAVAVTPLSVVEGTVIDCDGSKSINGSTFLWDSLSHPTIQIPPGAVTSFVAPDVDGFEIVQVRLTVINAGGAVDTVTNNVVVVDS